MISRSCSRAPSQVRPSSQIPSAVYSQNEEHGYVDTRRCDQEFQVGDRLRIIPNHVCVALNLHEQVYGIRNDWVEVTWRVEGRGKTTVSCSCPARLSLFVRL